jgi:hypothetical protein
MTARASCTVIAFPLERVRPAAPRAQGAPAEVLIFTGVRIVRHPEELALLPKAHAGSPRRKRGGGRTSR